MAIVLSEATITKCVTIWSVLCKASHDVQTVPSVALHLGRILPRTVFTDILQDAVVGHIVLLACSV